MITKPMGAIQMIEMTVVIRQAPLPKKVIKAQVSSKRGPTPSNL